MILTIMSWLPWGWLMTTGKRDPMALETFMRMLATLSWLRVSRTGRNWRRIVSIVTI